MLCLQVQTTRQQCFYCIVDFIRTCSFTACIDLFLSSYICNHNTTKLFFGGPDKNEALQTKYHCAFFQVKKKILIIKKTAHKLGEIKKTNKKKTCYKR